MENIEVNNDELIKELREMVEKRVSDILDATGSIKAESEKHKRREAIAKEALKNEENDINRLVLARIYIMHGKLPNATALVNMILANSPENILAKKEQLRIFLKQGHFQTVEQVATKVVADRKKIIKSKDEVDIDTLDFMSFLLTAYLKQNKLTEAEKLALEMDSFDLEDKGRLFRIVNETLARIYRENKNILEQEKAARKLHSKFPDDSKYLLMLVNLLESQGKFEEAYDLLIKSSKPNHQIKGKIKRLERLVKAGSQGNDTKRDKSDGIEEDNTKPAKSDGIEEDNTKPAKSDGIEEDDTKHDKSDGIEENDTQPKRSLNEIRKNLRTRILNGDITIDDIPNEKEKIEKMINPSEISIILAEVYMLLRMPQMAEICIRQALKSDDIKDNAGVRKKLRQVLEFTRRRRPVFDGLIDDKFNVIHGEKMIHIDILDIEK